LPAVVAVDPAELPDYDFGVTGTEGLTAAQKHAALIQFAGGPFRITDKRLAIATQAVGV
jgi:hypothetical protein